MKILAVVESAHQGNTMRVAEAMAEVAPVTIISVDDAAKYDFNDYDMVGFGSGIYYGKHSKKLISFVESLCDKPAFAFVFSTSGAGSFDKNNRYLIDLLEKNNITVLGSFGCKGLDKFFAFKLLGGINKGHPDSTDLKNAQAFILNVIAKPEKEGK